VLVVVPVVLVERSNVATVVLVAVVVVTSCCAPPEQAVATKTLAAAIHTRPTLVRISELYSPALSVTGPPTVVLALPGCRHEQVRPADESLDLGVLILGAGIEMRAVSGLFLIGNGLKHEPPKLVQFALVERAGR
jgi:hypothetical protein